jgi:DNA-binding response OmpR family regulator
MPIAKNNILVVEDDLELQKFLYTKLLESGYHVFAFSNGAKTLKFLKKTMPDIAILDMQLPDISGETICVELKKMYPNVPVIFLTAKSASQNVLHGFNLGADDYISKPFVVDELLARIKVRLKKDAKADYTILKVADLELNKKTFEVTRAKKKIPLTPKEFSLLEYLINNKNQVLTREQILGIVWQYNFDIESRVVDMYIGMLRKKIDEGFSKKLIHSVRGFGYSLKD